jgi:hypothetical protein
MIEMSDDTGMIIDLFAVVRRSDDGGTGLHDGVLT